MAAWPVAGQARSSSSTTCSRPCWRSSASGRKPGRCTGRASGPSWRETPKSTAKPTQRLYPPPKRALDPGAEPCELLLALLASPNIASRRPLFEQYDCMVGSRTVRRPEQADAAVLMVGDRAIGVSIDGSGRRVAADPYTGAVEAVLECAANLACVGAEPLGLTNCLNFGNPEKPEVMGQLVRAIAGIGEACRALGVPITGGNVSLYNETDGKAIYPTPVLGVVGLLDDASRALTGWFKEEGDAVFLLGDTGEDLGGSELLKVVHGKVAGRPPRLDLDAEKRLHSLVLEAASARWLRFPRSTM